MLKGKNVVSNMLVHQAEVEVVEEVVEVLPVALEVSVFLLPRATILNFHTSIIIKNILKIPHTL